MSEQARQRCLLQCAEGERKRRLQHDKRWHALWMITIAMQASFVCSGLVTRDWLNMMQITAREQFCTMYLVK